MRRVRRYNMNISNETNVSLNYLDALLSFLIRTKAVSWKKVGIDKGIKFVKTYRKE